MFACVRVIEREREVMCFRNRALKDKQRFSFYGKPIEKRRSGENIFKELFICLLFYFESFGAFFCSEGEFLVRAQVHHNLVTFSHPVWG